MPKFLVNKGYSSERTVEAKTFREIESLVMFLSPADEKVFAIPTKDVHTIERIDE